MDTMKETSRFYIPGATQKLMHNQQGNTYRIMTWTPDGEAPVNGYPVIYVLDGNAVFGTFAETLRLQSSGPRRQEPVVVVGIGYDISFPFSTERRFVDYTVPASTSELPQRKHPGPWPENGGADAFLDFIEQEIKPAIEQNIPIDPNRQALFGHSLGGFFTLYALFTRPGQFQYYAAGSPSVWWKDKVIFQYAEQFLAAFHSEDETDRRLFIGVGSEEHAHMVRGAGALNQLLNQENRNRLSTKLACYEGENHISVLLPFISQAIRDFRGAWDKQQSSFLI